ncbi:substrate-binding periplasmic protein [Curvivirga aplysinae]|uniref:substrate-binding periplasmic protein n=1 Tax=Curvivirga aplysinae TaxID=2529852 RepID=UPI0012BCAC87|nr:transporter substrate-binding domain-containing protein [Curvivirga aplysinae]MTI09227.1 transporter substrate-binding domain-containing protein [Curvivirga aplysinae]
MRLFLSSFFACLLMMAMPSSGKEIIRLTNGEWKPYQSEELPNYGPYSEIAKLAFAEVGIEVEFGFFPWNRATRLVEEGRWDGTFFWVATPERRQKFLLSNPVITLQEVIYYNKDRPLTVEQLSDFSGLTLGRIQSSAFGGQFNELVTDGELSVSIVPTNENLFKMLYSGRVDFVPELINSGYDAIDSLPDDFDKSKFGHLEDFQYGWISHMMISKRIEKGPYYIKQFNKGLRKLQKSGKLDEILAPILLPKRHQQIN